MANFKRIIAKWLLVDLGDNRFFLHRFLPKILHDDPSFELPAQYLSKYSSNQQDMGFIACCYFEVGNFDFAIKNILCFDSVLFDDNNIKNLSRRIMLVLESSPEQLLTKNESGETVLERLLKLDKRLGMDIASETVSLPIAIILKKFGFKPKISLDGVVSDTIYEEFYEQVEGIEYDNGSREYHYPLVLTEEQSSLVDQFQKKFTNDSDPILIKMVLDVFYKYLTYDVNKAMQYLNNFIILKEKSPNFTLTHISRFDFYEYCGVYDGAIRSNYDYYTLNHEMEHAIHDFTTGYEYPEHIRIMIEELKNDPDTIRRLQDYALRQQHVIDLARKMVADSFMSYIEKHYPGGYEGYRNKIKRDFENFISEMQKAYVDLDDVFDKFPIEFDDYFRMVTQVNENDILEKMIFSRYILEIENLMDAIFDGRWLDGILEGVTARCYWGHGIEYFQGFSNSFNEVFAIFSNLVIVPSDRKEQIEKDLRYLLGDELFDALLQYHNELNDKLGKTR